MFVIVWLVWLVWPVNSRQEAEEAQEMPPSRQGFTMSHDISRLAARTRFRVSSQGHSQLPVPHVPASPTWTASQNDLRLLEAPYILAIWAKSHCFQQCFALRGDAPSYLCRAFSLYLTQAIVMRPRSSRRPISAASTTWPWLQLWNGVQPKRHVAMYAKNSKYTISSWVLLPRASRPGSSWPSQKWAVLLQESSQDCTNHPARTFGNCHPSIHRNVRIFDAQSAFPPFPGPLSGQDFCSYIASGFTALWSCLSWRRPVSAVSRGGAFECFCYVGSYIN